MPIQSSLTQLLRDILSGGSVSARATREALIIPINRQTTMARMRNQVIKLFDRLDTSVVTLLVDDITRARSLNAPNRQSTHPTQRPRQANVTARRGGGASSTFMGNLIALAGVIAYKSIQHYMKRQQAGANIAPPRNGQYKDVRKRLMALGDARKKLQAEATDTSRKTRAGASMTLDTMAGSAVSLGNMMTAEGAKMAKAWDKIHVISEAHAEVVKPDDVKITSQARQETRSAVDRFHGKARNVFKDWIFSFLDEVKKNPPNLGVPGEGSSGAGRGGVGRGRGGSTGPGPRGETGYPGAGGGSGTGTTRGGGNRGGGATGPAGSGGSSVTAPLGKYIPPEYPHGATPRVPGGGGETPRGSRGGTTPPATFTSPPQGGFNPKGPVMDAPSMPPAGKPARPYGPAPEYNGTPWSTPSAPAPASKAAPPQRTQPGGGGGVDSRHDPNNFKNGIWQGSKPPDNPKYGPQYNNSPEGREIIRKRGGSQSSNYAPPAPNYSPTQQPSYAPSSGATNATPLQMASLPEARNQERTTEFAQSGTRTEFRSNTPTRPPTAAEQRTYNAESAHWGHDIDKWVQNRHGTTGRGLRENSYAEYTGKRGYGGGTSPHGPGDETTGRPYGEFSAAGGRTYGGNVVPGWADFARGSTNVRANAFRYPGSSFVPEGYPWSGGWEGHSKKETDYDSPSGRGASSLPQHVHSEINLGAATPSSFAPVGGGRPVSALGGPGMNMPGTFGQAPSKEWFPSSGRLNLTTAGEQPGGGKLTPLNNRFATPENVQALKESAARLGMEPLDLARIIAYESNHTWNPDVKGGKGGKYGGLIQMGPAERDKYGVHPGMSYADYLAATERYLNDPRTGWKPGMDLRDTYSAINTGKVGRYTWSDKPGVPGHTVNDHVANMRGKELTLEAQRFLAAGGNGAQTTPAGGTPAGGTQSMFAGGAQNGDNKGTTLLLHGIKDRYDKKDPKTIEASAAEYAELQGHNFHALDESGDPYASKAQYNAAKKWIQGQQGDVYLYGFSAGGYTANRLANDPELRGKIKGLTVVGSPKLTNPGGPGIAAKDVHVFPDPAGGHLEGPAQAAQSEKYTNQPEARSAQAGMGNLPAQGGPTMNMPGADNAPDRSASADQGAGKSAAAEPDKDTRDAPPNARQEAAENKATTDDKVEAAKPTTLDKGKDQADKDKDDKAAAGDSNTGQSGGPAKTDYGKGTKQGGQFILMNSQQGGPN